MTAIVCVDDNGGVMFNSRRQSQDKLLRAKIFSLLNGRQLIVSPYTAKQFSPEEQTNLRISNECYLKGAPNDVCFAEDEDLSLENSNLGSVVIFKWNRVYPADRFFNLAQLKSWKMIACEEFAGNSHENITMEVYIK